MAQLPPRDSSASTLPYLALAVVVVVLGIGAYLYFSNDNIGETKSAADVMEEFQQLVNASDPKAKELLAPRPEVPAHAIAEAKAVKLDAEFLLHRLDYEVVEVKPYKGSDAKPDSFVVVVKGHLSSEPYKIANEKGEPQHRQRMMTNPDIIVEVKDGKIHGLFARLHEE